MLINILRFHLLCSVIAEIVFVIYEYSLLSCNEQVKLLCMLGCNIAILRVINFCVRMFFFRNFGVFLPIFFDHLIVEFARGNYFLKFWPVFLEITYGILICFVKFWESAKFFDNFGTFFFFFIKYYPWNFNLQFYNILKNNILKNMEFSLEHNFYKLQNLS